MVLASNAVGLFPFTPLMERPAGVDAEAWFRQCVHAAARADVPDPSEYIGSMAILGNLVYDMEMILTIVSEETMYELDIIRHLTEKAAKENALKYIFEVLTLRLQPDTALRFKPALEEIDDLERLEVSAARCCFGEHARRLRAGPRREWKLNSKPTLNKPGT